MSNVTRNAAFSISSILASVTAGAAAATTTLDVIGDAASTLKVKSGDMLFDAQIRSAATKAQRTILIANDVALGIATQVNHTKEALERNPSLKGEYEIALAAVMANIAAATGQAPAKTSELAAQ